MTMRHYFDTVFNTSGGPVEGVLVTLTDAAGNAVAMFADGGGTPMPGNVAVTDARGLFAFYVPFGSYALNYTSPSGNLLEVIADVYMGSDATDALLAARDQAVDATYVIANLAGIRARYGTVAEANTHLATATAGDRVIITADEGYGGAGTIRYLSGGAWLFEAYLPTAPSMPKTAQTIHLTSFQWNGAAYSFRNDGVAVDTAAKAALRDLLLNSTASFLEIVAPPGVINLGTVADGAGILIRRGGVVLRGAGKNATRFQYYSKFAVLPTPADAGGLAIFGGFGIAVGKFSTLTSSWTTLGEVSLRDFTLEDVNPMTLANPNYTTTNAPDGIFGYQVNDVDLQSVRVINAKGNGAITFNGASNSSGPLTVNLTARDCEIYGDGGLAGGFADGDGYNIGSYANVNILGGFVINVSRHAIEGGTPGASIVVDGVYINQGGNGFSGVNPTGYGSVRVVNCLIVSIHNGYHVDLTCDPGVPGANMRDITIANNTFIKGSGSSVSAIRLQTIGGTTSIIGRVEISGNIFDGAFYTPVLIGANDAPSGIISGNDLSTCTGAQSLIGRISNSGASPVATDMLRVSGNILAPGVPIVKFAANVPEWQNTRFLRAEGNVRGRRLADAVGTEYGSLVVANAAAIGAAIPASSIAGPITLTIPDATPGDRVAFYLSPSWPVGPAAELVGYVTANNTVTVYVRNMTAAASAAIGAGNYFYVDVVRA